MLRLCKVSDARFGGILLLLAVGFALPQCSKSEDRTSWEDDLVVQKERYRRLGLDFEEALGREDSACIVRSERMQEVIIVGGRRRTADGSLATAGPPCDYDSVIMGAKTFIAGVEKATDRAMLYGGWRHAEQEEKERLFLTWFEEALTAGGDVVGPGEEKPLVAIGKEWQAPNVVHEGDRYVASGWVKTVGADGTQRFELRTCALTEELSFEGCSIVDAFGGE